jgi:hypothetical protein
MHMWHHVTNHLIISNNKDSNSENRINYASVTSHSKRGNDYIGIPEQPSVTVREEMTKVHVRIPMCKLYSKSGSCVPIAIGTTTRTTINQQSTVIIHTWHTKSQYRYFLKCVTKALVFIPSVTITLEVPRVSGYDYAARE